MNEFYLDEEDIDSDIDFDLPEDFEGNDIPYTLEHIDGVKLYQEFMNDCSDDYYLWLMKHGEEVRKRIERTKNNGSLFVKE